DLSRGKAQFEALCGACHGAGARGGRNGAPDMLISQVAQGDPVRFGEYVARGSPDRGMPPFLLDAGRLTEIQAHLKSLATSASRRGAVEPAIVGDADRGRAYFEGAGHCIQCHSASGDLRGIGARLPVRVIQGRIVLPRGSGVHPGLLQLGVKIPGVTQAVPVKDSPPTVTVQESGGVPLHGELLAISDFDVALRDAQGRYRSFERHGDRPTVTVHDPAQAHVDALGRVPDGVIHDLTAYLVTLR
ncbi:MAG: c-type cytochrome, partial [Pseudomonadota bacterium]